MQFDENVSGVCGLEAISERTLGEDHAGFLNFLIQIVLSFQAEREAGRDCLVVAITRRCHVLYALFLRMLRAHMDSGALSASEAGVEWNLLKGMSGDSFQQLERCSVTDWDLLTLSPQLVEVYRKRGRFPTLIILDELIIHGRTFNRFLLSLEQQVDTEARQPRLAWGQLMRCLKLCAYARSSTGILVFSRIWQRLEVARVHDGKQWRALSARFARLLSSSAVNNNSYSLGLCVPAGEESVLRTLMEFTPPASSGFRRCQTHLQGETQRHLILLWPEPGRAQALVTLRMRELPPSAQGGAGSLLLSPFVAFDHLTVGAVLRLHERIVKDIPEEAKPLFRLRREGEVLSEDEGSRYVRWLCETNELVLELLLLRELVTLATGRPWAELAEEIRPRVEYEMLCRNYRRAEVTEEGALLLMGPDAEKAAFDALWNWDPGAGALGEYLRVLLEGVRPFWSQRSAQAVSAQASGDGSVPGGSTIERAALDVIARIGCLAERSAFQRASSMVPFSDKQLSHWGNNCSLENFFRFCDDALRDAGARADLWQLSAVLSQAMELGLVGLVPCCGEPSVEESNPSDAVYTQVKAGEQALFIWPTRYQEFLRVLKQIQYRDRTQEWKDKELRLFLSAYDRAHAGEALPPREQRFQELNRFVEAMRESGQGIGMWDFPLDDGSGTGEEEITRKKQENLTMYLKT